MTPRDASDANDNRWSDLDRPPLNGTGLRRALVREGGLWGDVRVTPRTGSTNSDLVALATDEKADEGVVLVAEEQNAGRGRLDRQWTAPARSGLFFSVLLRPTGVPVERWGWLPLLTGVAVATALSKVAGVDTALKWPNDLLVTVGGEERKTGGILAERAGNDAVVVGIGINVTLREDELPVPGAGSSPSRAPRPRTVTPCCEPSCAPWSSGTRSGGPRVATPPPPVSRRRMPRDARPSEGWCVRNCPAARRSPGSGGGRRGRASGPGHGGGRTAAGGSGDIVHLRPA